MDEHSACAGAPTDNLIEARAECWEPRVEVLAMPGDAMVGTLTNVGWDETKEGVPTAGRRVASDLGRAATTLVVHGNTAEPLVPACRTDGIFGMVGSNAGLMAGVLATNGELTTGKPGNLGGDWGKMDTRGATLTWHACWGGTGAPVLPTLAAGTFC